MHIRNFHVFSQLFHMLLNIYFHFKYLSKILFIDDFKIFLKNNPISIIIFKKKKKKKIYPKFTGFIFEPKKITFLFLETVSKLTFFSKKKSILSPNNTKKEPIFFKQKSYFIFLIITDS